jgi:hypothetical protein
MGHSDPPLRALCCHRVDGGTRLLWVALESSPGQADASYFLALTRRAALALAVPRRAARLADEVARRRPRRVALASLLLFRFRATAFLVLRVTPLLFRMSILPSRSTVCAALLRVRAFCAASVRSDRAKR